MRINQKNKTESTKILPVSQPKQVAKKPAWVGNLSAMKVPHQRVKKTRIKKNGTKATTRDAPVSKGKLAIGKISVLNENRSVQRKPRSGRAGKPLEGLVQQDKPQGTFMGTSQHHFHHPSEPACKQSNTESISLPTGGEKPVTESINLPTGSEKPGREKSVKTIPGVKFAEVPGFRFTLDW